MKKEFINPQIATHLAFIEGELAKSTWFAGEEITAADVQMSFPLEGARARAGFTPETHPRIVAWLDRIHARPAYARAIQKGGPFEILTG